MDSDAYIRLNGKVFNTFGYLNRPDAGMTPSERGKAMQRRGMGLKQPKGRVQYTTCQGCGTAHQEKKCPWCDHINN